MGVPVLSWFDNVAKSAIKSVYDDINEGSDKFVRSLDLLNNIRERQFERLEMELGNIQVLSMTGSIRLADVYVPTRITRTVARNLFLSIDSAKNGTDLQLRAKREIVNAFRALKKYRDILLLGGPGSGKTMFVSAVVLGHSGVCENTSSELLERHFPVYIALRDLDNVPNDLAPILRAAVELKEEENSWPFIERMLKNGHLLIVLDGLDEIPTSGQSKWKATIRRFKKTFPLSRLIVTCRTAGLTVDFPGFKHFEVLPFSTKDVQAFVASWFTGRKPELALRLEKALRANPSVAELSRTPLLLALICILFESDLELPIHRAELYGRALDTLLVRWDAIRGFRRDSQYPELTTGKRRRLLQLVAATMAKSDSVLLDESEACRIIGNYIERVGLEREHAPDVLEEIESHHGIFVAPAANVRAFSHLSIQDFLTAEYLKETRQELKYLKANAERPRCREILVFLASILEDAGPMMKLMLNLGDIRDKQYYPAIAKRLGIWVLVARALAEGAVMSPSLRERCLRETVMSLVYATRHFQDTGLNLYFSFVGGEAKLRHTFYSQRPSSYSALLALEELVTTIATSSHQPLLSHIRQALNERVGFSTRAVIAACMHISDPALVLQQYKKILTVKSIPKLYRYNVLYKTIEQLKELQTVSYTHLRAHET